MISLEVDSPRQLANLLGTLNVMSVKHLRIHTRAHFWHTSDQMRVLVNKMGQFQNLLFLEVIGDSYPSLSDISNFLEFLGSSNCNLKNLKMTISPPFPGQYRIQDRTFMVNKILHLIYNCRSIISAAFYCKNREGEDNIWVCELNAKLRSILRNRRNIDNQQENDQKINTRSHL